MAKYTVVLDRTDRFEITVDAKDEDDAASAAEEVLNQAENADKYFQFTPELEVVQVTKNDE